MKLSLALFATFLVVLISGTEAAPSNDFHQLSTLEAIYEPPVADHGDRHRRVTCDLLSFESQWITFNHSACAARCLAMLRGYRGGHCDANGVCICRR